MYTEINIYYAYCTHANQHDTIDHAYQHKEPLRPHLEEANDLSVAGYSECMLLALYNHSPLWVRISHHVHTMVAVLKLDGRGNHCWKLLRLCEQVSK